MISPALSARIFEKSMGMPRVLDGYRDVRAFENFDPFVGWDRYAIFLEFIHNHLDDLIDVLQRFGFRRALRYRTEWAERRAVGVITALIGFHYDFERVSLHGDSISVYELAV